MCCSRMAEIHAMYINSGLVGQAHKVLLAFIASASSEGSDTDSTGSLLHAYSKKAHIKNQHGLLEAAVQMRYVTKERLFRPASETNGASVAGASIVARDSILAGSCVGP